MTYPASPIWWTGAVDYKIIVGGKPYFSPMFAFPVSYELTILFTAFATIGEPASCDERTEFSAIGSAPSLALGAAIFIATAVRSCKHDDRSSTHQLRKSISRFG